MSPRLQFEVGPYEYEAKYIHLLSKTQQTDIQHNHDIVRIYKICPLTSNYVL
jgi:hypothetical protein